MGHYEETQCYEFNAVGVNHLQCDEKFKVPQFDSIFLQSKCKWFRFSFIGLR